MTDLKNYTIKNITNEKLWNDALSKFSDANVYQSWNFSKYAQNEKRIQHIAFYKSDELRGLAAVRIRTAPFIKRGIAYILRGPVWQKATGETPNKVLFELLDLLRQEYVIKRKSLLRIKPHIFSDVNPQIDSFKQYGFRQVKSIPVYKTLILYLNDDLEEIRQNFKPRWRNYLNQAERNNLKIESGSSSELFKTYIKLYEQMHERKKFKEYVDVNGMYKMNNHLDKDFKLQIFIAYKDDQPVSGLVGTTIGDTSIYLLGASNKKGLKLRGSYLLQWEMIKWSKQMNCHRYDLGGIDPEHNPGVYKFKLGISKQEITGIGTYETFNSRLTKLIVSLGEFIKRVHFT